VLDEPQPDLRQQIEAPCKARRCAWCASAPSTPARAAEDDELAFVELAQMTPQDLFSRAWQQAYGNPADEQALADFAELLQDVQQEEEQP
jgi:exonuclease SbcD